MEALLSRISTVAGRLASLCAIALVFITVVDVTRRKLFQSGSVALQELEWHLFAALILLGAGYTLLHEGHVRVDIFYSRAGQKVKAVINILGTLVFLLPFAGFVVYSSIPFVEGAIYPQFEHSPDPGGLSYRFFVKALIPLGFSLLFLQGLAYLLSQFRVLRHG